MSPHMHRRSFLTLLGGAAAAWPPAARAQQAAIPVIGYLYGGSPETTGHLLAAFRKGLSETGYVEGRNVTIEYRWGHNEYDRLPEFAADLVRRRVTVIVTPTATVAALAAKAATTTIPIVFLSGTDPVQIGLVASFNRPGGNLTGVVTMSTELVGKRLGLLHELLPGAVRFAVLVNPNSSSAESLVKDLRAAAVTIGRQIEAFAAGTNREIDTAFANLVQWRSDALLVAPDPLFDARRLQIATLATYHRVPAIYTKREDTEAGGLMSYGMSFTDMFRWTGIYTGRILKGEKPADLPVMRPTKFEFIINQQTARTLGIEVPPTLLAIADEVIE
jgi:ABC-type uncharacterized transport system substrate-binding protein